MKIDVTNLFNGDNNALLFDYTLPLDDLVYSTYNPIKNGALIKGAVNQNAGVVSLSANVSFDFFGFCDRCAEPINKKMSFSLDKTLVQSLANEIDYDEYDDYIVVKNGLLDLDELITEEIHLFLPSKILCRENCKGLCPKCGKNLNLGKCGCKKDVDPRMEALLQLLDDE
ncbi:MAG: DUF177 domain-containing protein [Clostridiales bacterium]|nr:DUF177 domain-containing protein [Clostridiales bacterium]